MAVSVHMIWLSGIVPGINNSTQQLSAALPFAYIIHLTGKYRRTTLLELFGEDSVIVPCPDYCCDVYQMPAVIQEDRTSELSLLIQAVDELKSMG